MAIQPFKRLLVLFALLLSTYVLLLRPLRSGSTRDVTSSSPHQSIRLPNHHPFVNKSRILGSEDIFLQPNIRNIIAEAADFTLSSALPRASIPLAIRQLRYCPIKPNRFTNHIRLPHLLYNISMSSSSTSFQEKLKFWNPTIIALPFWAKNRYLVVSMVSLQGVAFRRNILCEANICHPASQKRGQHHSNICSDEDLAILGPNGGLRCVSTPVEVDVPPTPAERCTGSEQVLADIPGFHDPRAFFTGRGEPVLMVVSQSRYACIGLWAIDLRVVYPAIEDVFSSSPRILGPGPIKSFPTLTELTRNPSTTRHSYEKNWLIFSPAPGISYIQYEMNTTSRTFAKLIGGGLTTTNLTDPQEEPCLFNTQVEKAGLPTGDSAETATWHQSTPSLKLILCNRSNITCTNQSPDTVFFAAIQRKHLNAWSLPLRYERYFAIWSGIPPFNMLAVSSHAILFMNETNLGWTPAETWDDVPEALAEGRGLWGRFTYTTTIAYAWRRDEGDVREKGTGYLDDEVIVSVGIDDEDGLYAKARVSELLQCLRACPGRG